jgi:excisionase family DNA binding protein
MIIQNDSDKMLTVSEVAELLHVHPNTLRRWSDEGKIISYCITTRGDRRYRKSDIDSFLNQFNPFKDEDN